jgi:hypothetical protein
MSAHETVVQFPKLRALALDASAHEQLNAVTDEFEATVARENALREEIGDLLRCREFRAQELEYRLVNCLDAIASLLLLLKGSRHDI